MKIKNFLCFGLFSFLLMGCFGKPQEVKNTPVSTADEFIAMINAGYGGPYELVNDIDLGGRTINKAKDTGEGMITIKGNGHVVSNAIITSTYNASLLGKIGSGGAIANITFKNITVTGKSAAILASSSAGTSYRNITIESDCVIGDGKSDNVGGLVAVSVSDAFRGCVNKGAISGNDNVGGILGKGSAALKECSNYGQVKGYGTENVGGIVGYLTHKHYDETITNSVNYGEVLSTTSSNLGGIAGYFSNDLNENDYEVKVDGNINYGSVKGVKNVGGISGKVATCSFSSTVQSTSINKVLVTNCKNYGVVSGFRSIGGIAGGSYGDNSSKGAKTFGITYSFCSNLPNESKDNYVEGSYYVGGIAGDGAYFKNCTNEALVKLVESNDKSLVDETKEYKTSQFAIGGISGVSSSSFACEFSACKNTGDIVSYRSSQIYQVGSAASLGGIVGLTYGGNYVNNESDGLMDGGYCVGGHIGSMLPKFTSSMSNPSFKGNINCKHGCGGLIGYFETTSDYKKVLSISGADVEMNEVYARWGYCGGLVGYTFTKETDDTFYEKINIADSKASFSYYKYPQTESDLIQSVVGYNETSINGKKMAVFDEYTKNNSSCTFVENIVE